ncbi:MAG: hypothetical protein HQ464_00415 [Planctomycetes bacterium]|nr:hypothetical protein [Planctomycetota bacterium]
MAVTAMVFSADAAFAGGGGGSSKSSTMQIRIKNIGAAPVLVNAKNGAVNAAGGKTVSSNGVAQFKIKRGAANAYAQNQAASATNTLPFSFSNRVTVYLEATADATTATMTFAPPGKLF